ncbi:unnamed protein product, partial [Didymodactylos carnosus]
TVEQLIEQTKKGFYGDGGDHEGSIINLKNVKDYEEIYEKEQDEDEDDDINIEDDDIQ